MASAPSSSSLAQHLEAIYPVACVLAGPDRADALIERAYERAAEVPPSQRPSDERAWLFRLLLAARDESPETAGTTASPEAPSSADDDSFRRAVAVQTARDHLPVALAACSARQRFVLTLDVLDADEYTVAAALNLPPEDARSARDEARSALRASLRDVLNGPERMLVDVALPDEALRQLLRSLLEDEFLPLPPPLEARIQDHIATIQSASSDDDSGTEPDEGPWSALQRRLNTRTSIFVGLVLVFVAGGLAGLAYFDAPSPSPAPSQSLIELSTERAADLSATQNTESRAEAEAFFQKTWDRSVSIPAIEGAPLQGVGQLSLDGSSTVPALLYRDDETGSRIVAFVFNYALLDRIGDRVRLGTALREKLAANQAPLTRRQGEQALVLWRQRDDIFVLVAPDMRPDALRSRLQPGPPGAD